MHCIMWLIQMCIVCEICITFKSLGLNHCATIAGYLWKLILQATGDFFLCLKLFCLLPFCILRQGISMYRPRLLWRLTWDPDWGLPCAGITGKCHHGTSFSFHLYGYFQRFWGFLCVIHMNIWYAFTCKKKPKNLQNDEKRSWKPQWTLLLKHGPLVQASTSNL